MCNNSVIRAGVLKILPWLDVFTQNGELQIDGPYAKIHRIIQQKLNLSYVLYPSVDGTLGIRNPAGKWNGLAGMIYRKELDLVVVPVSVSVIRFALQELTAPVYNHHISILAAEIPDNRVDIAGYLETFSNQVWIGIMTSVVILSSLATICDYYSKTQPKQIKHSVTSRTIDNFVNYISVLLLKASPQTVQHNPGRILLIFWWLAVLVLMNAFQGHFKCSILLHSDTDRIVNVDDLLRRPHLRTLVWGGSSYEDMFNSSTSPDIIQLMEHTAEVGGYLRFEHLYSRETVEEVQRGQAVIFNEETITKSMVADSCSTTGVQGKGLYFAKEHAFPHYFTVSLRRGFCNELFQKMNRIVLLITEAGLVNKWLTEINRRWRKCSALVVEQLPQVERSLNLLDMSGIFVLVAILLGLSTVVLAFEMAHHKLIGRHATNKKARRDEVR